MSHCQEAGALSAFPLSLYLHMGLQLIEGIVPVFGNELRTIDGQLLVGIHRDQHVPNVGLEPKKVKRMSRGGGRGG